jgi:uncharacterized protein YdaU (DUF1376 family)
MTKPAPWIKFFAGDFLNGVADLQADEIGAYIVILSLIWDRGAPIPDDAAWLARRAGMSTRRFNQVRGKLIGLGKIEARNGLLGNKRAIAEVQARDKKSDQARGAALARWHGHQEPELPLGEQETGGLNADYLENKREKTQEQIDLESRKSSKKPQKSAKEGDADAFSLSRARAFQSPEDIQTNEHMSLSVSADAEIVEEAEEPKLDHRDLMALLGACTGAAGFNPVSPGAIVRELEWVKSWREAGIDFDRIVIPTIRSIVAKTTDPTSSLKRFDRHVRLEHAKAQGAAKNNGSKPYRPPDHPRIEIEGEDGAMASLRRDLLEALGPSAYCIFANPIRLEAVTDAGAGRSPLRIRDPRPGSLNIMDGDRAGIVRSIARKHGFDDIW